MTSQRAIAYIGGATLLLAWLAAASGEVRRPAARRVPSTPGDAVVLQTIATDVQAQAARLRARLASAPAPSPIRNPFAFDVREPRVTRRAAAPVRPAVVDEAPAAPAEPMLTLVGVAEQHTEAGLVRTAMLATSGDDLLMVKEGQTVAARYRVTAIGPDIVELTDIATGATRRLALQQ